MKLKQKIFAIAVAISFVPSITAFASAWTISHDAGIVVAQKSGSVHNTRYDASRNNRSGCANTLGKDSGYGKSSCAFLNSTNTSGTWVNTTQGHRHVYTTLNGALPEPSVNDAFLIWNVADFPLEY